VLFFRSRTQLLNGKREHGECLRLISFGMIWFYLALMIESSIFPILDVMFEHRLYLPSGGFFIAMGATAALLASAQRSLHTAAWIVLAVTCCVLTIATIQRNRIWNNDLLLWEDTASKSPNKPRVLANLAGVYIRERMPQKALSPLIRAIELAPGMTDPLNYLGAILDMTGKFDGRYDNGRRFIVGSRTVDMRYYNAWFANTRNNLGLVYEYTGNFDMAITCYKSAVTLAPTFELAWYNLFLAANVLQDRQQASDAIEQLKILNPERARYALLQSELHH
jgi:tetratricopeptide (TPR) repeat protein